ncbi:hypothetical protein BV25DRAFT_629845 [Artomyces pyxidatus]|uniref:Uncharacterized protein n=1 Tax=Artomyces pyxidatus TaxID=48021 RepID=A0ACB8T2R7_9AGAM|nr:hypothetical protein BV25DRAFT_629845 [Artomyces pyxidatus]
MVHGLYWRLSRESLRRVEVPEPDRVCAGRYKACLEQVLTTIILSLVACLHRLPPDVELDMDITPTLPKSDKTSCAQCGKSDCALRRCSKCRAVPYCSTEW